MCEIDFRGGDTCTVFEESLVAKARKPHKCDMCNGLITTGDSYIKHFSIFESESTSERMCIPCKTIRDVFQREHRIKFNPGSMEEMISECLQEDTPYDYDADEELPPITDEGLRWKHALDEMSRRRDARRLEGAQQP
jgi:hypothetical protein